MVSNTFGNKDPEQKVTEVLGNKVLFHCFMKLCPLFNGRCSVVVTTFHVFVETQEAIASHFHEEIKCP